MKQRRSRFGVASLAVSAALALPLAAQADGPANTIFGYEASGANARLIEYDVDQATGLVTPRSQCVPHPGPSDGRAVAYDKTSGQDPGFKNERIGRLYTSFGTGANPLFGDGLIHITTLPPACRHIRDIPFGEGPGPPTQDSIGAMDFDRGGGILWVAGYLATPPNGYPDMHVGLQILYKVDSNDGTVLGRCSHPSQGLRGNDTLTVANLAAGRGPNPAAAGHTGKVLLTDWGEFRPFSLTGRIDAVDPSSLEDDLGPPFPPPPCRIVASFPTPFANVPNAITGIDSEQYPQPDGGPRESLIGTNRVAFWDADGPPYAVARPLGSAGPSAGIEDISVERLPPGQLKP